jgi:putative spermidine/putrescine transport system permease protein
MNEREHFSTWTFLRWVVCGLVVAMMVAPLAIVLIMSFSSAPFLTFPPPGLSLQWYRKFFTDPMWIATLWTSVEIMIPTAVLATSLGTAAAIALSRTRLPGSQVIVGLLMAPLVVPVIITAAAIFGVFRAWNLYGTLPGLILAHTVLTIPFVLSVTLASMRMVDPGLENAALTLGATHWRTFWRVIFPLILPGIASGFLFALVISFDELTVSLFISTPEVRPITVQMWSDVRGSVDPTITAIASLLFAFTLSVLLLEHAVGRRARVKRLQPITLGF